MQQNISPRAEPGALHDSHNRNIALCFDAVSLQNIPVNHHAACEVDIPHGIVHIAGHGKYILHMETAGPEGQIALAGCQQPIPVFRINNVPALGNGRHGSLLPPHRLAKHVHAVSGFRGKCNIADNITFFYIMYQIGAFKVDSAVSLGGVLNLGLPGVIVFNMAVLPVPGRLARSYHNHLHILLPADNRAYLLLVYAKTDPLLLQHIIHHFLRYITSASGWSVNHHGHRHPVIRDQNLHPGVPGNFFFLYAVLLCAAAFISTAVPGNGPVLII